MLPQAQEIFVVALDLGAGAARACGAHDEACAFGHFDLACNFLKLLTIGRVGDLAADTAAARCVWHQDAIATCERQICRQCRAFIAALFLDHLNQKDLAHADDFLDFEAALAWFFTHKLFFDRFCRNTLDIAGRIGVRRLGIGLIRIIRFLATTSYAGFLGRWRVFGGCVGCILGIRVAVVAFVLLGLFRRRLTAFTRLFRRRVGFGRLDQKRAVVFDLIRGDHIVFITGTGAFGHGGACVVIFGVVRIFSRHIFGFGRIIIGRFHFFGCGLFGRFGFAAAAALGFGLFFLFDQRPIGFGLGAFERSFFFDELFAIFERDLVVVGVDFREGQKAMAIAAIIHEGRLKRRFYAGNFCKIYVSGDLPLGYRLKIKFVDFISFDNHDAGFLRVGGIDKHFLRHSFPFTNTCRRKLAWGRGGVRFIRAICARGGAGGGAAILALS